MTDELLQNPFYTHPCDEVTEDHARHVLLHQYTACIKIANSWTVPNDISMAWLKVPAVVDVLVGSCLWNPNYGYFRVVAFDKQAQRIRVQRKSSTTAAAGITVPICTKFIITPDL